MSGAARRRPTRRALFTARSTRARRRAHRPSTRRNGIAGDPLAETLHIDGQLALVDDMLHYFDRASMAHSLEVRVPFLDHHLVEYCATIPHDLKVRRTDRKHLLKSVARGIIPDRAIDKRKQGFFHGAIDAWFRAQSEGTIAKYLLDPNPRYAEFLDPDALGRLASEHAHRNSPHGRLLLAILILEVWLQEFLPQATASRATTSFERTLA